MLQTPEPAVKKAVRDCCDLNLLILNLSKATLLDLNLTLIYPKIDLTKEHTHILSAVESAF